MTPWDSNRDCGRRRPTLDLIRLESDAIRSLSSLFELTGTRKSLRRNPSSSGGIWLRSPDFYEVEECDRSQSNRRIHRSDQLLVIVGSYDCLKCNPPC